MKKRKVHEICFQNVMNDWDSALPVGNGKMGAMVFVRDHVLHIAVNHYDCYYRVFSHLNTENKKELAPLSASPTPYEQLCEQVDAVRAQGNVERSHYIKTRNPRAGIARPSYEGSSYPMGGEVLIRLDEQVDMTETCLKLKIEEAVIVFEAGTENLRVRAEMIAAREHDGILLRLSQTEDGLWKDAELVIPDGFGMDEYTAERTVSDCRFEKNDGAMRQICLHTVYRMDDDETVGAENRGELEHELVLGVQISPKMEGNANKNPDSLELCGFGRKFSAVISLMPENGIAGREAITLLDDQEREYEAHQAYWKQFWTSAVELPDLFLEKLWHMQLYLLDCSSGRGCTYPEHACGLSGLWDIRRPNMWGSMWYWDANIQSAFWGMDTAGHPELTKLFCDGYLAYEQKIRNDTRQKYGIDGWALDYPHTLYHCIQPWCAQFLWEYYQYSGDMDFLENKVYPVFKEQIAFFEKLADRDEEGIYHVRYDISPEQGPVTEDSVITIACIKKLLKMAMEASEILGYPAKEREKMSEILNHLPKYRLTADGSRYKDSALAQDDLYLRHPSMFMPVFPAEEIGPDTPEEELAVWENTLRFASERIETVTFGMGWLSAVAARLGKGRSALRLLYEKGLDHAIHSNGLAYEESERYTNYCHVTKPPHSLPVMMEAAGGIVNAVNKMLIQTGSNGEILIFPAVPDEKTPDILEKIVQYHEYDGAVEGNYEDWENVSFCGFRTPGGFRVSAQRREGTVTFLKIESTRSGILKLRLPKELSKTGETCLIEQRMNAGEVLIWGRKIEEPDQETVDERAAEENSLKETREESKVLCHQAARTQRRVFLGEDRHTAFYKAVDSFTGAYLFANEYRYFQTPYVFDFGPKHDSALEQVKKDYNNAYPKQLIMSNRTVLYSGGPRRVGADAYSPKLGYGFAAAEKICAVDRKGPDDLRRDFLEGTEPAVFALYLPKGKYDLLFICGDEEEESQALIRLPQYEICVRTGLVPAGCYACRTVPFIHEQDGKLEIAIAGEGKSKWKWNSLLVNKEHAI